MKTNLLLAATAAFAVAAPSAANANNCATIVPADSKGAALHTTWYGQCLTNDFSFGVWAKGLKSTYGCYPFDSQNAKLQRGSGSQDLTFTTTQVNSSDGTTTSVKATLAKGRSILEDESWHFYCCTFHYDETEPTASFQRLYIDGTLKAEKSGAEIIGPVAAPTSGNHVTLAGNWHPNGWANYSAKAGSVSEITVWSKALTASEVSALCARRAGGFEDGLVVYWPLAGTSVTEPNRANGGPAATLAVHRDGSGTFAMANDPDFPLDNTRCVASAEWIAEHGYVQSANATFRTWDDPATNIADAVAVANPSETILLMPGTHPIFEQIDITKANLTVAKKPDAEGEAVIDAQGLCRHFSASSDNSGANGFVFDGLTLRNGVAGGGGSMYFKSCVGTVRNCVFENNTATNGYGGALNSYFANGTVVSNCVFRFNNATEIGGAAYTQQSGEAEGNRQNFIGCVFSNNVAHVGGGIGAERCVLIDGCRFADNFATNSGTALYRGGGHGFVGKYSRILNSEFTGKCSAREYGACLDMGSTDGLVSNCVFRGMEASGGYAMFRVKSANSFVNCVITDNVNADIKIFFPDGVKNLLVRQSLIAGNTANQGVVWNWNSSSRFENCTILQQTFSANGNGSGTNALVNCVLPNANVTSSGKFANILTNCLVKSVSGGTQDSGVMTGDPKFVAVANGDYRLAFNSPCREKGLVLDWMTADAADLAGDPRLVNILGKAAAADALPDLGCYECQERGILPTIMYVR